MPRLIAALALGLALAAPVLPAAAQEQSQPAPSNMSPTQRKALRAEVRAYLLEHPEVIAEAIHILEARRQADQQKADARLVSEHSQALFHDPTDWVGGNPKGDITLVEFFDYRCAYCKKARPEVQALLKKDPNVRYVAKEFPILGPDSVAASRMALAALEIDRSKYGALHDALLGFGGQLTKAAAYKIAGNLGYDTQALRKRAASHEIEAKIKANYKLADALAINGTPGFVLGNRIIRGYIPLDQMTAQIAKLRQATN